MSIAVKYPNLSNRGAKELDKCGVVIGVVKKQNDEEDEVNVIMLLMAIATITTITAINSYWTALADPVHWCKPTIMRMMM